MTYDPRKTQAENLADLQEQIDATERELNSNVMGRFDISDEEWDALPKKIQTILIDYYEAAL
jgi:hypothetical protein